jgi:hypothetical protein
MKTFFIKLTFAISSLFLSFHFVNAQETYTAHTLTKGNSFKPCVCRIQQLNWMAGNWQGIEDSIINEEQWVLPIAGTMMGMFRMIKNQKPIFYELMLLSEGSSSITLRLKHFWYNLKGWEHKDSTGVVFPLLKVNGNKAFFDGLTYELLNKNELIIYLAETTKTGGVVEEIFRMKRTKS